MGSCFLILNLKEDEMEDSGREEEGKTFQTMQFLGMNNHLRDRGSEILEGGECADFVALTHISEGQV